MEIDLLLTVPAGAQPDTVHTSTLTATAQNDTTRSDTIDVDVAASMVTELSFIMANGFSPVEAGSTTVMSVEVQNLADRPDILSITAELSDDRRVDHRVVEPHICGDDGWCNGQRVHHASGTRWPSGQ